MVWGAIAYNKKWPLVKIEIRRDCRFNAARYADEIIWPHLSRFVGELTEEGRETLVVEDGATIHHAPVPRALKLETGIVNLMHPAASPDLNPIENMWRIIKSIIRRATRVATCREELWTQVQAAWEEIPMETVNRLIFSMEERRLECVAARGGSTSF